MWCETMLKCKLCGADMEDMEFLYYKELCKNCRCGNCAGSGMIFKNRDKVPVGPPLKRWEDFDFTQIPCIECKGTGIE